MMGAGIDYGRGMANIDTKTGIRFGVIPADAVDHWYDSAEPDYGDPSCPECGEPVTELSPDERKDDHEAKLSDEGDPILLGSYGHKGSCWDYVCHECELTLDSDRCFPESPLSHYVKDEQIFAYSGEVDIFVERSLYFTYAPFCSPCAPGACYLLSAHDDGAKAYCFGHDWFEGGKAPYDVFRVDTGEEVFPEITVPEDYAVQPLSPDQPAKDRVTCGVCGLSWDDGIATSMTPTPSGRCPFEAFHKHGES